MPVDAVIFDYGGVLSRSPFASLARLEASLGLEPGALSALLGYGLDVAEPEAGQPYVNKWHLLEIGAIEFDEYAEWVADRSVDVFGERVDIRHFFSRAGALDTTSIYWPMVHEARRLRDEGVHTAICTNNIAAYRALWQEQVPVEVFEVLVDSSEVGVRKPDRRIYELTAERLGVAPEACVFLDDHPGNVAGAEAVGMRGILVDGDIPAALATLHALLA